MAFVDTSTLSGFQVSPLSSTIVGDWKDRGPDLTIFSLKKEIRFENKKKIQIENSLS